jgi:hypothetical protein
MPEVSFLFSVFSLPLGIAVEGIANILMPPKSVHRCEYCGATFEAWTNLNYHRSEEHEAEMRG